MNTLFEKAFAEVQTTTIPWFEELRKDSFNQFLVQGLPSKRNENWKYTDITSIAKNTFVLPQRKNSVTFSSPTPLSNSHQIVFINGFYNAELSNTRSLPDGVIVTSLLEALQKYGDLVKPYFSQLTNDNSLEYLNVALLLDGLFLWVPKNTCIDQPIHIRYINTAQQDTIQSQRNIVIIDAYAKVTIIEEFISDSENSIFNNHYSQVHLDNSAQLTYYKSQNENKKTVHVARTQVQQQSNSQLNAFNFSLGGKIARDDFSVMLNGRGADCKLYGYYHIKNDQQCDQHTRIDHKVANTSSYELYKGIMEAKSQGVFNGKVVVHPNAKQTKAQLINQNLLMAKNAEINTKPELEIYANDVQCTHGATVSKINEKDIFYLRSRGIDEQTSIQIIKNAFVQDIIEQIPDKDIKRWVFNIHRIGKL